MKPTRLDHLHPSRRLFLAPACVQQRRLMRLYARVGNAAAAVAVVSLAALIGRYLAEAF